MELLKECSGGLEKGIPELIPDGAPEEIPEEFLREIPEAKNSFRYPDESLSSNFKSL